jgi:hypothetical protein
MLIIKSAVVAFAAAIVFVGQTAGARACLPIERAWLARQQESTTTFQTTRTTVAVVTKSSATRQSACSPNVWLCIPDAGKGGLR